MTNYLLTASEVFHEKILNREYAVFTERQDCTLEANISFVIWLFVLSLHAGNPPVDMQYERIVPYSYPLRTPVRSAISTSILSYGDL